MIKNIFFLLTIILLGCSTPQQDFSVNYHPQKFKINLQETSQVKTEKGLKINFNEEVIERIYGLTKTYSIEVQVYEFYTIEDFVFNNLETITTDGELLESAGMFKIDLFYEDDFKIDLKNAKGISLEIPSGFFDRQVYNYKIFEGEVTEEGLRWESPVELDIPNTFQDTVYSLDSLGNEQDLSIATINTHEGHSSPHVLDFYTHELKNLEWVNIDRYLELGDEALADVHFRCESQNEILSIGVIIPGAKSYIECYQMIHDKNNFISNIKLPKGENINIVGLAHDGENYFLAREEAFVGKTDLVELDFEKVPKEEIMKKFRGK